MYVMRIDRRSINASNVERWSEGIYFHATEQNLAPNHVLEFAT